MCVYLIARQHLQLQFTMKQQLFFFRCFCCSCCCCYSFFSPILPFYRPWRWIATYSPYLYVNLDSKENISKPPHTTDLNTKTKKKLEKKTKTKRKAIVTEDPEELTKKTFIYRDYVCKNCTIWCALKPPQRVTCVWLVMKKKKKLNDDRTGFLLLQARAGGGEKNIVQISI